MSSKIIIVNEALTHLGSRRIASLSDANDIVRAVNAIYDDALAEALRSADWNFARTVKTLTLLGTADQELPGYDYVYGIPANCMAVRSVFDEGCPFPTMPNRYEILRAPVTGVQCVACDIEDAYCRFTYLVIDPTVYDADFVRVMSLKLAAMLAPTLTRDMSVAAALDQKFEVKASEARRINFTTINPKREESGGYIDAR